MAGALLGIAGPASALAFGPAGSFDGTGSGSVAFSHPQGAAVTGSTVYVADTGNNRVPYYTAGVFQDTLSSPPGAPSDVALGSGTCGIVAAGPSKVVCWTLGLLPLISWTPPGVSYGVAGFSGSIYVSDSQNGVIRKYDPLTAALQGTIGSGQLVQPQGMTADGAGLYVADPGNGRIVRFDAGGNLTGTWTMPSYTVVAGGQTFTGRIEPHDVAVDGGGRVFAPDAGTHSNLVAIFGPDGSLQQIIGSPDSDPGNACTLRSPWGIAVNANALYVVSTGENRVRVFDDNAAPCPQVNFGPGGGITASQAVGGGGPAPDRARPKVKLTGFPSGCARHNFAFTIHASDDVQLKRLTLLVNHRRVANQQINKQQWNVKVKIPVSNVRRQLPRGASVRVLVEVRVADAAGKKARVRRAFRICG